MNNNFNNDKNNSNEYVWNDAMILDKIQEILNDKNLDDLEFTPEELENLKNKLNDSLTLEEVNESACVLAENIKELKEIPKNDIKEYISTLINYLNEHNLKCVIGEFNGIEFEVFNNSNVDDVFNEYYAKYDETYGISDMLSDLGFDLK